MTSTLDPHHGTDEQVPHDIGAEQSVLGGVLLGGADTVGQVQELISALDFYRPAHQIIFEAVCALADRGEPHDAVAVNNELVKRGEAIRVGGALYLHTLTEAIPTTANAGYYAKIVADQARLRRIMVAGIHAAQMARTAEGDLDEIATRATEQMERARLPRDP
ncbi:DnaB-like helicase N-terminal domain-containing protein [Nocardiopsis dassonvillei]|uniref:DnaB-like helicase N-terminal domain-containing protein n=1 Tax=Nocardiopsis dassonvillei TaxID=2014 RepID=UPI003F54DAEC